MQTNNYDYLFKIIIIGDSNIGKSSILYRFSDDVFNNKYISTIGVDFKIKTIVIDNKIIKLQIWDTAGQERFRTITTSYYRGSHIIILCYDTTDRNTFLNLTTWLNEISKYASNNVNIIICGTKNDIEEKRQVSYEEAKTFANIKGYVFYETSSKENINIDEMFINSSKILLNKFLATIEKKEKEENDEIKQNEIINNKNNKNISIEHKNNDFTDILQKKCCF